MKGQEQLGELPDEEFTNAVFVRAEEPAHNDEDGITLTRREFELCAPEPLSLVVLLHWRVRERDGQTRTAEAIWATLRELDMRGADGETLVRLEEVADAVDFLLDQGLTVLPQGGEL